MRNTILEKSYKKCGGEAFPRPFYKKSKLIISLDQRSEILYSFFIVYSSQTRPKYVKPEVLTTCFYLILKLFLKNKRSRFSLPASFSA